MRKRVFYGLWICATVLMLVPGDSVTKAFQFWDKAQHALGFAALAIAALWADWARSNLTRVSGILLLYGAAVECIQALLPWRSGDIADFVADAVGLACVVGGARLFPTLLNRIRPASHPKSV